MGEIDDRTVAGLYEPGARRQPDGAWRWAIDMWNSDAG